MNIPGLLITGTDTDVGKTWVTALIARQLMADGVNVGAYKPVCSGAVTGADGRMRWSDVETLAAAVGGRFPRERICPQCFVAPAAPPVAAREEGLTVDSEELRRGAEWWSRQVEFLLIEGVGGLLCPVTETDVVADLAAEWMFPLIIVSHLGLGTINHTLLTVEVALSRGLRVAGVILNECRPVGSGIAARTNAEEIAKRCPVPVLGTVEYNRRIGLLRVEGPITMNWRLLVDRSTLPETTGGDRKPPGRKRSQGSR